MDSKNNFHRLCVWLFYGLMFFLPFEIDFEIQNFYNLWITPLILLAILLFFLFLLVVFLSKKLPKIPHLSLVIIYGLGISVSYLKGFQLTSDFQILWVVFRLAWLPIILYLVALKFLNQKSSLMALKILSISASISSLFAVIQTISGGEIFGGFITNQRYLGLFQKIPEWIVSGRMGNLYLMPQAIYRGHGGFHSSNLFGAFLSLTMCISWFLWRSSKRNRWVWLLMLILQGLGIIVTFSRSAWAAILSALWLAIVLEVIYLSKSNLDVKIVTLTFLSIILGISILTLLSISEELRSRFISLFNPLNVPEFVWRLEVWEQAIGEIIKHPLFGTGTYDVVVLPDRSGNLISYGAHNLFVGLAYQNGLISLMIFVYILWHGFFYRSWYLLRRCVNLEGRYFGIGIYTAGVALVVSGIGSSLMAYENISFFFWILIGMVVRSNFYNCQFVKLKQSISQPEGGRINA